MKMNEQMRAKVRTYLDRVAANLGDTSEQERQDVYGLTKHWILSL